MKDKPGSNIPRGREEAILARHRHLVLGMCKFIANIKPNLQNSTEVNNSLPNSTNTPQSIIIKLICHLIHRRVAV